jgi:EAL domain-containing protein (putative c-di-GMP-specific phosphodiesterase class I)/CheY-like chemotaxis protein
MGSTRGRILIVDDDVTLLRTLARVLRRSGHEVTEVMGVLPALDAVMTTTFDVLVSDIRMPGMSGIDLIRAVRRHDTDVPVILLTGSPSIDTAMAAVEAGALQYLLKPVDVDELVQSIARACTLRRLAVAKRQALALAGNREGAPGDRASLEMCFENALDTLWLAFQPIVDCDGHTFGYEALLRSREPALPTPDTVLTAAERLGRITDIGRRIRALAARDFRDAPGSALLFLNLHAHDLSDEALYSDGEPLKPLAHRVILEVTERASLDGVKEVPLRVAALRKSGFRLAVDDLGAGYAGLTSFALLEPEFVKLDMSLVRDVHDSVVKQRVIGSITNLCHDLRLQVVAEGVEVADEQAQLRSLGCDLLQGFLFARPRAGFTVPSMPSLTVRA